MFDLVSLIKTAGYLGIFAIIFAESGVLVGIFFPGDSLLFTAGLLASQGFLNIFILIPVIFLAAVLGDNFGYFFGKKIGPKIFTKEDSFFFSKDHIVRAESFYEKYGKKTIVIVRFIPVIRTIAPILAGVGRMKYSVFFIFNIMGAFLWGVAITWAGYYLGKVLPNFDKLILPIVLGIIIVSTIPAIFFARGAKKTH